ncbi:MAG: zf-HC2 domain-containing protein [Candidatus Omnitrophica bacterium]|nr:zf-HC2 domain-containing protein [Candidatus Omnitrophota bacterium]
MDCEDIKTNLKLFLDDLLVDKDYQAFCQHMEGCEKCKKYVRSISSLSNQLWKLGQLIPPLDLSDTIKYKLAHSQTTQQIQQNISLKQQFKFIIPLFLTFLIISFIILPFFSYRYFEKKRKKAFIEKKENILTQAKISPDVENTKSDYVFDVIELDSSQKPTSIDEPQKEERPSAKNETVALISSEEKQNLVIHNLHWHVRDDYNRLKNCLSYASIISEYEKNNLFIFKTGSEKLKILLEKFVSEKIKFLNFTKNIDINFADDKEYRVIIFVEDSYFSSIHWDIGPINPEKRKDILNLIENESVSINYKSDDFIIFSISESQLKNLYSKLEIFGVPISEFKNVVSKDNILISGPIEISVFLY